MADDPGSIIDRNLVAWSMGKCVVLKMCWRYRSVTAEDVQRRRALKLDTIYVCGQPGEGVRHGGKAETPTGEDLLTGYLPTACIMAFAETGFCEKVCGLGNEYGSLDSKFEVPEGIVEVPDGIAHFLEHKLFEEPEGNVFDRFAQLGASVNAFTSYTQTAYLFSTVDYL